MLVGREKELEKLRFLAESDGFELVVIHGRWQVGKTSLVRVFSKEKGAMYLKAMQTGEATNARGFRRAMFSRFPRLGGQDSLSELLRGAYDEAGQDKLILVIDDFDQLDISPRQAEVALSGLSQEGLLRGNLMLVVCVQSFFFPELERLLDSLGEKLKGCRITAMGLSPLNLFDSAALLAPMAPRDLAMVYGATGGVPGYLTRMKGEWGAWRNLTSCFFSPGADLYGEPENILRRTVREPRLYNAILQAVAQGSTRNAQIAAQVGLLTSACTAYLNKLIQMGIIQKELIDPEKSVRKSRYSICDPLFHFWYSQIPDYASEIHMGRLQEISRELKERLDRYMEGVFTDICGQWLLRYRRESDLTPGAGQDQSTGPKVIQTELDRLKEWMERQSLLKKEARQTPLEANSPLEDPIIEIQRGAAFDLVAKTQEGHTVFADCFWTPKAAQVEDIRASLSKFENKEENPKRLYIFSAGGFSQGCLEAKGGLENVFTLSLSQMIG